MRGHGKVNFSLFGICFGRIAYLHFRRVNICSYLFVSFAAKLVIHRIRHLLLMQTAQLIK